MGDDAGRVDFRFTDREAKVWAAEQARSVKADVITVLLVSPFEQDRVSLCEMLARPRFRVFQAKTCQDAEVILRGKRVAVVITGCNLSEGCWKDVSCAIERLSRRPWPRLIVAAESAPDSLWAEILNAGACDIITKPFDSVEIVCCVQDAWLSWKRDLELEPRAADSGNSTPVPYRPVRFE